MVTRLRRLEGLLGRQLDDVDYNSIADLVGNAEAAESEDLDYKQAHYSADDKGREELAKDVASFANHTGGLLLLGMAEDKGVPSKVFDVDLDDRHLRHIRQVIANNTAPPVPYEAWMQAVHEGNTSGATSGYSIRISAVPGAHPPHSPPVPVGGCRQQTRCPRQRS